MSHAPSTNDVRTHPIAVTNYGFYVFRGAISLIAGICALAFPISAVFVFAMMFAGWCFGDGVLALATAIKGARSDEPKWWTLIARGVLGLLVGVLFISAPGVATLTYAMFTLGLVAAWALVAGALEIATAIRLRKVIAGEWLMAASGVLSVLLGALLFSCILYDPAATLLSTATLIGIYLVMSGLALLLLGSSLRTLSRKAQIGPLEN